MIEALKQFRSGGLLSYVVTGDLVTRSCVAIDPHPGALEEYRAYFFEKGLKLLGILLTAPTAESNAAALLLQREYLLTGLSDLSDVTAVDAAGGLRFKRFEGGRAGDFSYLLGRCLFAGVQIAIGSAQIISPRFTELPDSTLILPSIERNGVIFSTLGMERSHVGGEAREEADKIPSINTAKFALKIAEGNSDYRFLDVREPSEFADGHMPGAKNIPISELSLHWEELKSAHRVYLCCYSGRRSQQAAQTLNYLELPDVVHVAGGFQSWVQASLPIQK